MPIKDIRTYIDLCMQGTASIQQRRELLQQHKKNVLKQQQVLHDNLKEITTKIQRYANEDSVNIIKGQIKFVQDEKKILNLEDPFK